MESDDYGVGRESYCRIGIEEFISGSKIKFGIFVRLSEGKFTKIAHEGEEVTIDRIQAYKNKNAKYLYVRKEDFAKYVGINLTLTRAAKNSDSVSNAIKLQLSKNATSAVLENLFVNGVSETGLSNAKELTGNTLELLSGFDEGFDLLESLRTGGDSHHTHSLGVSLFSVMIAKEMGWKSPVTLFKVSMAGLLHDIGMRNVDRAILDKPRKDLKKEEIALLETHCAMGAEILGSIPSVPNDVLQIVLHHHEACHGGGYPAQLTRNKINPIARLIAVADEFCELALPGPNTDGMGALEAIDRLQMLRIGMLDPVFLSKLKGLL